MRNTNQSGLRNTNGLLVHRRATSKICKNYGPDTLDAPEPKDDEDDQENDSEQVNIQCGKQIKVNKAHVKFNNN